MPLCHEQSVNGSQDPHQTVLAPENLQPISFQMKPESALSAEGTLLTDIQQVLQNLCAVSFSH